MLIPALDLIQGQVVRLHQGDFEQQTTYHSDPVAVAKTYQQQGSEWIHLVDLDGAKNPEQRQLSLIERIALESGLNVQTGGGIRQESDLTGLFEAGVQRVVIGSLAVTQPELVATWMNKFGPDRIVLALDINIDSDGNKWLATHGWQKQSSTALEDCVRFFTQAGLKHVLCTDISKDGTLKGPNVELYKELKAQFPNITWQASGGVSSLDDLVALKRVNCDSAILGKALLTGQFNLQEALSCWRNA
ncbi:MULTISPECIES: 1-(5-phosphoribosyl)-5-[(5-phosphoribosylamino)methylideneamino]imidazole-4-carboxamide isomerase [Gammaproteobacteria]|uniref:1-(5-phosphoribosyl)-5-[(5- phosphoribosylamino)methylideneamino]imidazole-4- carboxamide isomerase n=1 Tax=Gammaproteobacteria TaxID=1236 RepID=UPI000DD0B1A2|nr:MULTISPECIES: 1-(5-phosphoribosyl)-5-[(5-phosphoribosylamino)methylideneamino]imidazole-4-carboxamide isomerase [Gammaproteobacteria]RTE87619.1 1-(5-phosphoribosyl)-5-[(5-phosphoribosylamino)methylideneamino]imidazole-4-carboxamide isomerase [Aliidiomarina sp. B3213]TCZ92596.1 1-(5-phosphoribosyl)-5-[(5-phosphoribosylamino)methylideneamino]imidazole-4-carboxamide isomerase [Lysobacter sp. N42]